MHRVLLILLSIAVTTVVTSTHARAQDPDRLVEVIPDDVLQLNEEGIAAVRAGDLDTAVKLLTKSLGQRDLNVTWVNLGRAYARQGDCKNAREAYNRATMAARVASPPPLQVYEVLYQYRKELDVQCAEEEDTATGPAPWELEPEDPWQFSPWSWITLGTGGALLVTALVVDLAVVSPRFDDLDAAQAAGDRDGWNAASSDINTLQQVNIGLFAAGTALVVVGGVLVIVDALDNGNEPTDNVPTAAISRDGAQVGWVWTW